MISDHFHIVLRSIFRKEQGTVRSRRILLLFKVQRKSALNPEYMEPLADREAVLTINLRCRKMG